MIPRLLIALIWKAIYPVAVIVNLCVMGGPGARRCFVRALASFMTIFILAPIVAAPQSTFASDPSIVSDIKELQGLVRENTTFILTNQGELNRHADRFEVVDKDLGRFDVRLKITEDVTSAIDRKIYTATAAITILGPFMLALFNALLGLAITRYRKNGARP